jgi:glycosyltransferase involved in cell wall biosynthesis
MLERLDGFEHQRFYLSSGRSAASGAASIPLRWPRLAATVRSADLVHTHGDVSSTIALPFVRARPVVVTTHGLHLVRRARGPAHPAMSRALRSVVSRARVVICTSAAERDELELIVPARDRHKLTVIHNGVEPAIPLDRQARALVRQELGARPDTVLALFAGRLEPRKAPLLAAHAAIRVRADGVPLRLVVAGDGPQTGQLRALSGDAVKPIGYRSDLPRLLSAADVFVQPSEREGISLALLEAMAHGLAIVAADGPGNPEAVGDAGLVFGVRDEAALVAALEQLCTDSRLRALLAAKALSRSRDQFGVERFLAATEAVYRQAAKPLRAPGPDAGERRA